MNSRESDQTDRRERERGRRPEKEEPRRTWLVIPYDDADAGARDVPNGDCFWESPNIRITNGDAFGNAIAGKPTPVKARVWNMGNWPASPVRVDFAFVDASLGIPWSDPRIIGTAWDEVPGQGTFEFTCPELWTPPDTGSIHSCLLVMCSCPLMNDTPVIPWTPQKDRHVGQKNLTIVPAGTSSGMKFQVLLTNLSPFPADVALTAQGIWRSAAEVTTPFPPLAMETAMAAMEYTSSPDDQRLLAKRVSRLRAMYTQEEASVLSGEDLYKAVRIEQIETTGFAKSGASVTEQRYARMEPIGFNPVGEPMEMKPLERRLATISVQVPDAPHDSTALVLRVAQTENRVITGGYTFVFDTRGDVRDREYSEEPTEVTMAKGEDEHGARARDQHEKIVNEIVEQLAPLLPLRGLVQLSHHLPEGRLAVLGQPISLEALEVALPKEVFPISEREDLHRKVRTALEVAIIQIRAGGFKFANPKLEEIAHAIAPDPLVWDKQSIPSGHFGGPSVFGGRQSTDAAHLSREG